MLFVYVCHVVFEVVVPPLFAADADHMHDDEDATTMDCASNIAANAQPSLDRHASVRSKEMATTVASAAAFAASEPPRPLFGSDLSPRFRASSDRVDSGERVIE